MLNQDKKTDIPKDRLVDTKIQALERRNKAIERELVTNKETIIKLEEFRNG